MLSFGSSPSNHVANKSKVQCRFKMYSMRRTHRWSGRGDRHGGGPRPGIDVINGLIGNFIILLLNIIINFLIGVAAVVGQYRGWEMDTDGSL